MESGNYSEKFLKDRKFYTVIPILVLPFLTLFFWALGGGQGGEQVEEAQTDNALNVQLPTAVNPSDSALNKMAFYWQAERDSIEQLRMKENDPYYVGGEPTDTGRVPGSLQDHIQGSNGAGGVDASEAKVLERLSALDKSLNANTGTGETSEAKHVVKESTPASVSGKEVERLEKLMSGMDEGNAEDPELRQLSGMLDRILDIQHPERVKESLRKTSTTNKGQVFAVTGISPESVVSTLDSNGKGSSGDIGEGFFTIDQGVGASDEQNAIAAVVHETQTVVDGATVKLRLTDDIFINGQLIPKDHFVFGTAKVSGERLEISIESVLYKQSLYAVNLAVYDMDGVGGIYIPGSISRDVSKETADRSLQSLGMASLDPSVGAQAMTAGIEATKNLLTKKVKLIKVTVKAGYKILLKDENRKED
ncbi:conjugative transposon protein TraM [Olivibacter domesticus]|uniref:Bacteroides conjugative transposon TraM protein n=1 Tax=Olivibacter domesticus TaxID=407022 RepID=A0A1H7I8A7_OLID1|nr:conjugative transposon protein TraM [Olivibacter domesticus]SEK58726.1 Bacteroides conjugative transposon TraM protein [Olivibacter domesticus]